MNWAVAPVGLEGWPRDGVAAIGDFVFVPMWPDGGLARLDAGTGSVLGVTETDGWPWIPIYADGSLWTSNFRRGVVTRLDVETGTVTGEVGVSTEPRTLDADSGSVWVASEARNSVDQIDAATCTHVRRIGIDGRPRDVLATNGSVWVPSSGTSGLARIDALTGSIVDKYQTGIEPARPTLIDDVVWVASGGSLLAIDTHTGVLTASIEDSRLMPAIPMASAGSLWVEARGGVLRLRLAPAGHVGPSANSLEFFSARRLVGVFGNRVVLDVGMDWTQHKELGTPHVGSILDSETGVEALQCPIPIGGFERADGDQDGVWIPDQVSGAIHRLDLTTGQTESASIGTKNDPPSWAQLAAGSVWCDGGTAGLNRISLP